MATCLDLSGADYPQTFNERDVIPLEGYSTVPIFEGAPFSRPALYREHEGNCAVRKGEWKLVKKYPGDWELYDMVADRTELNDVSRQFPEIVSGLLALYREWAGRCAVMPWDELLEIKRKSGQIPGQSDTEAAERPLG